MSQKKSNRLVAKPLFATPKMAVKPASSPQLVVNQQLKTLSQNFKHAFSQNDFNQAVKFASRAHQLIPQSLIPLNDIASNLLYIFK